MAETFAPTNDGMLFEAPLISTQETRSRISIDTSAFLANPMDAPGDIIVGGAAGAPERLGIGANGDILTVSGGTPAWEPPGGGGTVTHTGALTADQPMFGNGAADSKVGSKSGNTDELASVSGAVTSGHLATWDASGNLVDGGALAAVGGVNSQTANYLATATDNGKAIVMNGVSLTVTLPAVPPSPTWNCQIVNLAATNLTINPNGLLFNGNASNLQLFGFEQGVYITTDGTNYFFVGGRASKGTSAQFGVVQVDGTSITSASGVISATAAGTVTHTGALTVDLPMFGNGTADSKVGTKSGNTDELATVAGAVTSGHLATWDASGNLVDGGAPGSGALTRIAQQVLGAPAATVTFSGIPATFTNLLLVLTSSSSAVAISDAIYMQFNGDTAANYGSATFFFNFGGTGNGGSAATATPNIGQCGATTTFGAPSSGFSIEIPGYAGTVFDKTASAKCMASVGNVSFVPNMTVNGLVWKNTAAIVSVLLGLTSGANFIVGSVFTLYGLA